MTSADPDPDPDSGADPGGPGPPLPGETLGTPLEGALSELRVAPGTLLLSSPDMLDPNFMHTVVLMFHHNDEGAFGVVINRPTGATIGDVLPDHASLGCSSIAVHGGGPVGLDSLQILHRAPQVLSGGIQLAGDLHLGAEIDEVGAFIEQKGAEAAGMLRFVVGYAGWGSGQLDAELATGSWVPCAADIDLVFSNAPSEDLWRRALRGLGGAGAGMASLPPDPSWN